jgi:antitoxin component YwqK of YwqJK toxin-antitoxin module
MSILNKIFLFLAIILSFLGNESTAQDDKKSERQKKFTRDSIPELNLTPDTLVQTSRKKKKLKKKVFYGIKTKKGFTKTGRRDKQTIETFFYLKKYQQPDPYIKDIYVWDLKQRKVIEIDEVKESDQNRYKILHGPYKKTVGGNTVELGIFYVGTKHARWEKFGKLGKEFVLTDKSKYDKGWQRDAEITYYDNEMKKVKEVKPYKFGALNGTYYYFLENGHVLVHGKYKDDVKIGLWVEYFKDKDRRQKETQYPKDPYTGDQFAPFVLNEWNDKGNPVIKDGKPFDASKARKGPKTNRKK